MKKLFYLLLLALLVPLLAAAAPDEATGRVTKVVDGDTIDVQLSTHDSRISEDTIRVRLADIDTPEMSTLRGPSAKDYTTKWLQSAQVSLDLDDRTGKDPYSRWVAVVYMVQQNGTLQNFNRALVDAEQACIQDFDNNEFNPGAWWGGFIPATSICARSGSSWAGPEQNPVTPGYGSTGYSSPGYGAASSVSSSSNGPFVGSSKSDKYHYPGCSAAQKIKASNLVTFASSAEARAAGYVPCSKCNPP